MEFADRNIQPEPTPPSDPMELIKQLQAALTVATAYMPEEAEVTEENYSGNKDEILADLSTVQQAVDDCEAWLEQVTPHVYGKPETAEALAEEGFTALQVTVQQTYLFEKGRTNGWDAKTIAQDLFSRPILAGRHAWRESSHLGNSDVVLGVKTISDPFPDEE